MGSARRLFVVSGGGSGFAAPSFAVSGPYSPDDTVGATLLTQLHCHTTSSDGTYSPAVVVADYLGRGYDVLALTDHNMVTTQPDGIATEIPANELGIGTSMPHVIGLNPGAYSISGGESAQTMIDGIRAAGGEAHVAHPNWIGTTLSAATLAGLTNYYGMEIHNGKVMGGVSASPVTNPGFAVAKWDAVLATKRDTFAVAVDDLHDVTAYNNFDTGRVQVFVSSPSMANVIAALVAGRYVADVGNYGVTPGYPNRGNLGVSLECAGAVRIEAWGSAGLLAGEDSSSFAYGFTGAEDYVRLVAWGDYTEPFDSLPHPWTVEDGTWVVSGGVLSLTSTSTARHIILPRHREGDFSAQMDVKLEDGGGNESAVLMFNVLNTDYFYGIRIGESASGDFNNKLAVFNTTDGGTTTPIIGTGAAFTAAMDTWYTVKTTEDTATGRIRAKAWERGTSEPDWMVDVTDTDWTWGGFGIRANFTPDFDNWYVRGFKTYYQPIRID